MWVAECSLVEAVSRSIDFTFTISNLMAFVAGGYNTAGLGGVGGPYRLDIGQTVYQLPDSVKNEVPEHIREKAREMAQKAYKQRLKEIQMSKYDAEMYQKLHGRVEKQITQLRVIIDSLQVRLF